MRTVLLSLLVVGCNSVSSGEGLTVRECTDGEDNDDDGDVDCDDDGCADYDVCLGDDSGGGGGGGGSEAALTVNEFQAANATTFEDESGAFPDWIELYNYGDDDLSLNGYTITDDLAEPDKHSLDGLSVAAGQYLVLFADDDADDSLRHLTFNLDKEGEEIGLYDADGRTLTELTYSEQGIDWSAGRFPDASDNWDVTDDPTPGATNGVAR